MAELPESAGSGPPGMDAEGGEPTPGSQDRPRLVAVPKQDPAAKQDLVPQQEPVPAPDPQHESGEPTPADPHAVRLEFERALSAPPRLGATSVAGSVERSADATEPAAPPQPPAIPEPATPELVKALHAELAMRATAEAVLRARVVDAETRLAARTMTSQRTAETLRDVRAELERLADLVAGERTRREAAERRVAELERELREHRGRSDDADREIGSLRESLAQLQAPASEPDRDAPEPDRDPIAPGDAGAVQTDRLSDALTRLRANAQPIEAPTVPAVPATLAGPFRTLCRRDPALAGRLAISLLGMERIAYPHPIAFDLLLGPGRGCIQVTSSAARTDVVAETTARPLEQVGFRVVGGPDRLARLLVAGRLRRRLGFGVARVRGDRDGLAALEALLALPLDLPTLVDGGMLSDSRTMLSLVAAMVRPEWTRGAHFAVSHLDGDSSPSYLVFSGGRRPEVTPTAPAGPIATVISCADHDLASVLTGAIAPGAAGIQVLGDAAPLTQLQGWIKRAQSG